MLNFEQIKRKEKSIYTRNSAQLVSYTIQNINIVQKLTRVHKTYIKHIKWIQSWENNFSRYKKSFENKYKNRCNSTQSQREYNKIIKMNIKCLEPEFIRFLTYSANCCNYNMIFKGEFFFQSQKNY